MVLQAHVSGQMPSQAGSQLPGLTQPNVNALPQMTNLGGIPHIVMDREFQQVRLNMRRRIFEMILQRQQQQHPVTEFIKVKCHDSAKRLEEGLFRSASSKEDYMNMQTLQRRLACVYKQQNMNNQNQPNSQTVRSSLVGTMIPTPGMLHVANSSMASTSSVEGSIIASSGCNSLASSSINGGNIHFPGSLHENYLSRCDGIDNGYQQSSTGFSIGSGENLPSMGVQGIASQMIPSPGFAASNHSYMNIESSNANSAFSNVDSTVVSQSLQKQHFGGKINNAMQNLGNQMCSGMRPGSQQKSFAYSNGAMGNGVGSIGDNVQAARDSETTDCYATTYGNSPNQLQQHFDQNRKSSVQGDSYGLNNANSFASGNIYTSASSESIMNSENMNPTKLGTMSKENSLISSQSSLHGMQHAALKSYTINQLERLNFQPSFTPRDGLLHHQQQYQQPPQQFHQPEHYVQQQAQLKLQSQQPQNLVNNDGFCQSQAAVNPESQVKSEAGVEHHEEVLNSQVCGQFYISGMQTQFGQRTSEEFSKNDQHLSFQPVHNAQTSHQMLHPQHLTSQPGHNSIWPLVGTQSNSAHESQWNSQSQDINHIAGNTSKEQLVQSDFHQQILSKDEAQFNNLSSDPSIVAQSVACSVELQESANTTQKAYLDQRRWLLFMFHARRCVAPEGQCLEKKCPTAQKLCKHIEKCDLATCSYPRCSQTKVLLSHFKKCKDPCCPVCVAVRNFLRRHVKRESQIRPVNILGMPDAADGSCKSHDSEVPSHSMITRTTHAIENSEGQQPSQKRLKFEHSTHSLSSINDIYAGPFSANCNSGVSNGALCQDYLHCDTSVLIKSEPTEVKEVIVHMANENLSDATKSDMEDVGATCEPVTYNNLELGNAKTENETTQDKSVSMTQKSDNALGTKSGKPKIKAVSMIELFQPELVKRHITGLRQWIGQSKAKAEKNQAMEQSMSENSCQLCAVEKLAFDPPPIYCSICGTRFKRNAMYYTCISDTRHYVCTPCYNEARGDSIVVDGTRILKGRLEKKKNDEETEEWWVQCDKCEAWQHQICALFNGKKNVGGQAEYTCPNCYVQEVERGERTPLPENAVLGAKDLPRTFLSDHLEQRLFKKLEHERQERARLQGKSYDEVPGAEQLVIRVVSSVDKKLEVKQRFLEIFQEENYPTEFPYKSKVVLLFQKIEGVEVFLFGMYVQEFGTECQFPNQRRVYLSYLDSVKYFRPEIKAVTGEALRTYVYHEILIGYLEYCKKRGFTSCYIWACPPLKGEDYILYCHPEIQKTPKSDKLREWYLSMLRKAAKDDIVVNLTNLYDHFFVSTGECRAKVTAARLPYFDGDYWPGAAEDLIHLLSQEEDGRKQNKKGTIKKTITKRALKASGQTDLSGNASKDLLLMHKLGEAIGPMKEDFIMVHLQHACNHCCILMVSGNRWVCNQCKNFQICDKCYEAEQSREERERHPINQREKHFFKRIEISGVPSDTKDKDEILESEFFDTRQAFLSLCQGNHYQYDTLRRAKHSSMMILYHLHNPTAPAFVTTCNLCNIDIETGQGWRCETCPEFDVCNACYQKGVVDHQHKLTRHPSSGSDSQSKEARQQRVLWIRKMLDLLLHASQCRTLPCMYPNCRKVKMLFRHGMKCEIRASGGCSACKIIWDLLQLHARTCKESQCRVPRCRDLREHLRRLQQQSDSRRRAAVNEMMRERAAAEAANNVE